LQEQSPEFKPQSYQKINKNPENTSGVMRTQKVMSLPKVTQEERGARIKPGSWLESILLATAYISGMFRPNLFGDRSCGFFEAQFPL
jgi:hypothetical protein